LDAATIHTPSAKKSLRYLAVCRRVRVVNPRETSSRLTRLFSILTLAHTSFTQISGILLPESLIPLVKTVRWGCHHNT
jgi:hypothetical protein